MASTHDMNAINVPAGVRKLGSEVFNTPVAEDDITTGFRMNHVMLRITRPEQTLPFYTKLLGMRVIFTFNAGPMTIYYLGHPHQEKHRSQPETFGPDMDKQMSTTSGLLELCHYHGAENEGAEYITNGSKPPHLGFNHLGFTMPDVSKAVAMFREAGVKVIKDVGDGPVEDIPTTAWEQERGIGTEPISRSFMHILKQVAFVEDPDGYMIELVPQVFTPPPH